MQPKTNQSTLIKLITAGAFLSFFLFGFVDNLKGPILPELLDDLDLNYAMGGTIILGAYLGFLISTLTMGPLSDVAGKPVVILVACVCLLVGMIGFSIANAFWMLLVTMTIVGLGMGALEVGGNLIMVDLHSEDKGRYLNLLAFFHGIGSMIVPLCAGQMLKAGFSWRSVYRSGVLIVALLLVYFLIVKYPKIGPSGANKLDLKNLGKSAFGGEMILFYAAIALYVAAEIGVGAWLVEFLQAAKSQSLITSTLFLSLFFGAITLGRFVGSFLVERIGYLQIMLYASLASVVFIVLGTFAPPTFAFFLPLSGLFFSIIFPTITAAVSDLHVENIGTILGLLFTCGGVGGMLGPWLIGIVSDWLGIEIGFGLIAVFFLALSATLGLLIAKRRPIRSSIQL